jgi:glucokinase
MPALGIDLGGTKLSAAVICDQRLVTDVKQRPTPSGPDKIVEAILDLLAEFKQEHVLVGVGIATAGIVKVDTGEVIGSTGNLPGWEGTPIRKIIERKTMLPVHVENDANASAYGEFTASDLKGKYCLVVVTLGTGIGVGIIIDGKLFRGSHWAAGECGHIKISMENRRLCTCGLFDCWEAYGSGRGLLTTGKELIAGVKPEQSKLAELGDSLTNQAIIEAVENGDLLAQKAFTMWHEHICAGLINLAHTLDPDCFVLTGGMEQFVDYPLLRELVSDRCLPRIAEKMEIRGSVLGKNGGMVGAAELVLDRIAADA